MRHSLRKTPLWVALLGLILVLGLVLVLGLALLRPGEAHPRRALAGAPEATDARASGPHALKGARFLQPVRRSPVAPVQDAHTTRLDIEVRTLSPQDRPVDDAGVDAYSESFARALGRTDAAGSLTARLELPAMIVVRAEGFVRAERYIEAGFAPNAICIELAPLTATAGIAGRLALADGTRPAKGARAIAWPVGKPPTRAEVHALQHGVEPARLLVAHCAADGSFELDSAGRTSRFAVGGFQPGACSSSPAYGVRGGDSGVVVELEYTYAVRVVAEHAQGAQGGTGDPSSTPTPVWGRGPFWKCLDPTFQPPGGPSLLAALAGVPTAELEEHSPAAKTLVFRSQRRAPRAGPIVYEVELPGYEPVWTEVWADSTELPLRTVHITPRAVVAERGAILVRRKDGVPGWFPHRDAEWVLGEVHLAPVSDGGAPGSLNFPLHWTEEPATVEGVPAGTYAVEFRPTHGSFAIEPFDGLQVQVRDGRTAELELDFSRASALLLEFVRGSPPRSESLGAVRYRLTDLDTPGRPTWHFAATDTPLVAYPMRPANYALTVTHLARKALDPPLERVLELRSGELRIERAAAPLAGGEPQSE